MYDSKMAQSESRSRRPCPFLLRIAQIFYFFPLLLNWHLDKNLRVLLGLQVWFPNDWKMLIRKGEAEMPWSAR